jgi:PhoH-like ATPase
MITLEELDGHKKGMTEVARNAARSAATWTRWPVHQGPTSTRRASRWTPPATARPAASCSSRPTLLDYSCPPACPRARPTTRSWAWWRPARTAHPARGGAGVQGHQHARQGARAGPGAEDYQNDKTLEDGDLLYTGVLPLPADFWERHGKTMESWQQGGHTFYRISGPMVPVLLINQFVYFEAPGEPSCMPASPRSAARPRCCDAADYTT